jgi:hypothetical protein
MYSKGLRTSARLIPIILLLAPLATTSVLGFDVPAEPRITQSQPSELLRFLPLGYICTILVETPVLLAGLSREISLKQRLFSGIWLTACTYPIVVLVLPMLFEGRARNEYLTVAEVFAPVAECALFFLAFRGRTRMSGGTWARNFFIIICANLLSFFVGETLIAYLWPS